jgi:hypothetical protein
MLDFQRSGLALRQVYRKTGSARCVLSMKKNGLFSVISYSELSEEDVVVMEVVAVRRRH